MNSSYRLVVFALILLGGGVVAQGEQSPVYSDNQLDVINGALEKWKPEINYPVVKDLFKDRSYRVKWSVVKEDAGFWDQVPTSFENEREACKAGCICDYIKSPSRKTCLLKLIQGQGAYLFVYDADATGKFVKTGAITPSTWYGYASVALLDVCGTGKMKFILIEHNGNTGTGLDEKIHWLIGWHKGAFRTVLRETVFLYNSGLGDATVYRMNYTLVKGKSPRLEARCAFDKVFETAYPYELHASWRDWLFWNGKAFSFYNARIEDQKIELGSNPNDKFNFRLQIEKNRKKITKLPPLPKRMLEDEAEDYWKGIPYVEW
jgi:hypothetical protein